MQIGIGIGIPFARGVGFAVASLFSNNEVGAWYDPSDLSTLFQDAAGTTPVTAVEQPVSLMLDKSKGLVIGSELISNGDFASDTVWTKGTGWSIGSGVATKTAGSAAALAQSVTVTAGTWYRVTFTATRSAGTVTPRFTGTTTVSGSAVSASGTYTMYLLAATGNNSFDFNGDASFAGTIDNVSLKSISGNHAYTPSTATGSRPTLSARYNLLVGTAALATQNVTVTAGTHTLYFTGTGDITLSGTGSGTYTAGTHTITTTAGTLTLTVSGSVLTADMRRANDGVGLPAYQAVVNSTNYDSSSSWPIYLRFDGSDDYMLTNSIDFTGTDKMTVWSGVRKLSDAAAAFLVELSASSTTNAGAFSLYAPANAGVDNYRFLNAGTIVATITRSGYAAPLSNVLTLASNIEQPLLKSRIDTNELTSFADQGTGTYGNYPLYIGRRGGTTLPFTGRLYGLIVRGAHSTDSEITNTEAWMNQRTRAY